MNSTRVSLLGVALAGATWSAVQAAPIDDAILDDGIGRGFGVFLGTWDGSDFQPPQQPHPSGNNAATIGKIIKAVYPGFAWDPDTEFNLAGSIGSWPDGQILFGENLGLVVSDIDGQNGRWDYLGFPDGSPEPNPGNEPVDLFIAVKGGGGQLWSVFYYDSPPVSPGEFGYFTIDHRVYNQYEDPNITGGYDVCEFQDIEVDGQTHEDAFSFCMPWPNSNNPYSISHVTGYWPPGTAPEPAILGLFGLGLLGIGMARRRRSI